MFLFERIENLRALAPEKKVFADHQHNYEDTPAARRARRARPTGDRGRRSSGNCSQLVIEANVHKW